MFDARSKRGIDGLKKYVAALSQMKDPKYKRLVKILSSTTPEQAEAYLKSLYSGKILSEVKPEKVNWLWKPRLALGKITMFDGDPGLGKSLIGASLGSAVTKGGKLPDRSDCPV